MWRNFMNVMVTIAAISVVTGAIVMGILVGNNANQAAGVGVFFGIVLIGFILLGTMGMIVEGVGYLKTIAQAVGNGNQNGYMQSQQYGNTGYTYSQTTGRNTNYTYGQSPRQGGSVAVSNAKGKSILEAMQAENGGQPQFEAVEENAGGWMCDQCGEKNEEGNVYCKYCGTHK